MLFDLHADPEERDDLAETDAAQEHIARLEAAHFRWARRHHNRTTKKAEDIDAIAHRKEPPGILIGYWDRAELLAADRDVPKHAVD